MIDSLICWVLLLLIGRTSKLGRQGTREAVALQVKGLECLEGLELPGDRAREEVVVEAEVQQGGQGAEGGRDGARKAVFVHRERLEALEAGEAVGDGPSELVLLEVEVGEGLTGAQGRRNGAGELVHAEIKVNELLQLGEPCRRDRARELVLAGVEGLEL